MVDKLKIVEQNILSTVSKRKLILHTIRFLGKVLIKTWRIIVVNIFYQLLTHLLKEGIQVILLNL